MSFSPEQVAELSAPLSSAHVKSREQAGRKLSYLEAWHAIAEANRIFGFDAWNRETVELRLLGEPRLTGDKYRVGYMAKVRITVGAIVREGCGFGSGIDKDVDQAHESALKEAESDAMKRALMTFGNPFGLALYDKTQANVADEAKAPSKPTQIKPEETGLYGACKAAMDLANDEETLAHWAEDNKASMQKMHDEYPEVHAAVRRYYGAKLQAFRQKVAA